VLGALDNLPPQYAERLANLDFAIARVPLRRDRRRLQLRGGQLYGVYEGVPLTQRGAGYDQIMPDRITVFWGPLLRDFPDETDLADQIRKTVYHELAHYFGLDEHELRETAVE
jgi:predicted Zn-dependent protease with MMP-like domain